MIADTYPPGPGFCRSACDPGAPHARPKWVDVPLVRF